MLFVGFKWHYGWIFTNVTLENVCEGALGKILFPNQKKKKYWKESPFLPAFVFDMYYVILGARLPSFTCEAKVKIYIYNQNSSSRILTCDKVILVLSD